MTLTPQDLQKRFDTMSIEAKRASITDIVNGFDDTDLLQHNVIQLMHRLEPLSEESCQIVWQIIQEMSTMWAKLKDLHESQHQQAIKDMISQHEQLAHQQAEQADADLLFQL